MPQGNGMICPDCRIEMNCHAEKIDYEAALSELEALDPDLGGVVEEAHTCPECGQTLMRKVNAKGKQQS